MVAFSKNTAEQAMLRFWRARFEQMLPQIRQQAAVALRAFEPKRREKLVAEIVELAFAAFLQLVERGYGAVAYVKPSASSALKQLRSGRHPQI